MGHENYVGVETNLLLVIGFEQNITSIRSETAWNSASSLEIPHLKTVADPCSTVFRVPTESEYRALLALTTQSYLGNWIIVGEIMN